MKLIYSCFSSKKLRLLTFDFSSHKMGKSMHRSQDKGVNLLETYRIAIDEINHEAVTSIILS